MKNRQLYRLAACLIGAASLLLQSCSESRFKDCDRLCGSWSSVEGKPDVLIYKEGDAYKVTVFARSGKTRKLKPETYLLVEENGNLFINTGYRIDIAAALCRNLFSCRTDTGTVGGDRSGEPCPEYHQHVGQYRAYLFNCDKYRPEFCGDGEDIPAVQEIL